MKLLGIKLTSYVFCAQRLNIGVKVYPNHGATSYTNLPVKY